MSALTSSVPRAPASLVHRALAPSFKRALSSSTHSAPASFVRHARAVSLSVSQRSVGLLSVELLAVGLLFSAASLAEDDIRDIRGPKFVLSAWMIAAAIGAVVLLALLAYGIWRWRQKKKQPRILLSHELALQQLDGIRPLMFPATAREFSIAVSDIVRVYIERRFDVIATHRTTEEFLRDLLETAKPALARHRGLLADFLQQCDLVKFGGMSLSSTSMESLYDSARAFVLETAKPDLAAPPEEARDAVPAT